MNQDEFNEMLELIRNKFSELYTSSDRSFRNEAQNIAQELTNICDYFDIELS